MPAQARIEGRATLNDAEFQAGLKRMEDRSKTLVGRMENLFQFRGERRAARGTGLFGAQILAAQSGVDVLEASVLGLANLFKVGFGATIGAIAGVAVFNKLKGQIDETDKSAKALAHELALPRAISADLGPEAIGVRINTLSKGMDDLAEKSKSAGSRVQSFLDEFVNPAVGTRSKGVGAGRQHEVDSAARQIGEALADQSNAEAKIVDVRETGLKVSERQAALRKIDLKEEQDLARIAKERFDFKQGLFQSKVSPDVRDRLITENAAAANARSSTVRRDARLSREAENQKFDIQGRQVAVEQDLANLAASGASADAQAIAEAQDHLGLIQDELNFNKQLTEEKRKQLEVEQTRAVTALHNAQYAAGDMRTEAVETRNEAQLQNLRRSAFETNIKQAESGGAGGQAYGAAFSGIGRVGPETPKSEEYFNKFFHKELIEAVKQIPAKLDEHLGNADFMEVK